MKQSNKIALIAALMISVVPMAAHAQMAVYDQAAVMKMIEEYAQHIKDYMLAAQADLNRTTESAKSNLLQIGIEKAKAEDQQQRENQAIMQDAIAHSQITSKGCDVSSRGVRLEQTRDTINAGSFQAGMAGAASLTGSPNCGGGTGGSNGTGSALASKVTQNKDFDGTPVAGVYGIDQAGLAIGSGKTIDEAARQKFLGAFANFTAPQSLPATDSIPAAELNDPKKAEQMLNIQKSRFLVSTSRAAVTNIIGKLASPGPGQLSEMDQLKASVDQGWGTSETAKAYGASLAQANDQAVLLRDLIQQIGVTNALLYQILEVQNGVAIVAHTEAAGRAYREGSTAKSLLRPEQAAAPMPTQSN